MTVSPENEKWVLVATILPSSMSFIDYSALNVALPTIQRNLGMTGAELLWVVNAYALFLSALLLLGGALGDLYGRKKIFMLGIAIFCISSLMCGLAVAPSMLIFSRSIQGLGGALMVPGSLAIISALFPDNKRGKAIGAWSMFSALTTVLGPVLGGWLAGIGLWRWIFFINLPIGFIAVSILVAKVPENRDENAQALDLKGALLVTLSLVCLTYGFIQAPEQGWTNVWIVTSLIGGGALFILFLRTESASSHPMLPLGLFKSSTFSAGNFLTLLIYAALSAILFFLPLNFVQVQGYSEQFAGLAILPFALLIASLSRWAGGLVDRFGPRPPLIVGPSLAGAGALLLSLPGLTAGPQDYWTGFFPAVTILGIGMGITVAPLTTAVMASVSNRSSGTASGINNTVARSSGVFAIAVLGAFALFSFEESLTAGASQLDLSESVMNALRQESSKFAEAKPPPHVGGETAQQIELVIKKAFVDAFNKIGWVTAGLCWIGVLLSAKFIKSPASSQDRQ